MKRLLNKLKEHDIVMRERAGPAWQGLYDQLHLDKLANDIIYYYSDDFAQSARILRQMNGGVFGFDQDNDFYFLNAVFDLWQKYAARIYNHGFPDITESEYETLSNGFYEFMFSNPKVHKGYYKELNRMYNKNQPRAVNLARIVTYSLQMFPVYYEVQPRIGMYILQAAFMKTGSTLISVTKYAKQQLDEIMRIGLKSSCIHHGLYNETIM